MPARRLPKSRRDTSIPLHIHVTDVEATGPPLGTASHDLSSIRRLTFGGSPDFQTTCAISSSCGHCHAHPIDSVHGDTCAACTHMPSREPRRRVCPWPHLPCRGRGASGGARIAADAHHGRLWGRSSLSCRPIFVCPHRLRYERRTLRLELRSLISLDGVGESTAFLVLCPRLSGDGHHSLERGWYIVPRPRIPFGTAVHERETSILSFPATGYLPRVIKLPIVEPR